MSKRGYTVKVMNDKKMRRSNRFWFWRIVGRKNNEVVYTGTWNGWTRLEKNKDIPSKEKERLDKLSKGIIYQIEHKSVIYKGKLL